MAASILDAILAQAKATITRGYLAAGLIPALAFGLGWALYEARSLARLDENIKPLLAKPSELSATTLLNVTVVAALGFAFYAGRGLILKMLQDVPGKPLEWLRRYLMARQINVWWRRREVNERQEQRFAVVKYLRDRKLDIEGPSGVYRQYDHIVVALKRSKAGRERFVAAVARVRHISHRSVEAIVDGIDAFYSIPLSHRQGEKTDWVAALDRDVGGELVSRLYAEVRRRLFAIWRDIHEQPLEEWWLAPTRLGNRVAALQDYAKKRYKIPTSTLFTRLWGTLGQAERLEISNAQLTLEALANVAVTFAALAVIVATTSLYRTMALIRSGRSVEIDWWTIGFVAVCVGLWYASYSAAVFAFQAVAENITRLIDLHRVRILTAFGFAPPETFGEEQEIFEQLNEFFADGSDENIRNRKLEARIKPLSSRPSS